MLDKSLFWDIPTTIFTLKQLFDKIPSDSELIGVDEQQEQWLRSEVSEFGRSIIELKNETIHFQQGIKTDVAWVEIKDGRILETPLEKKPKRKKTIFYEVKFPKEANRGTKKLRARQAARVLTGAEYSYSFEINFPDPILSLSERAAHNSPCKPHKCARRLRLLSGSSHTCRRSRAAACPASSYAPSRCWPYHPRVPSHDAVMFKTTAASLAHDILGR